MKELCCGFSQIDITPQNPNEVFLDGYGHRMVPAQEILDPIYAKVCTILSGEKEFVLASLDICGLNAEIKDRLCERICLFTGLSRSQFALCATHTHAAPACGVLADLPINLMYWNGVSQKISQAICSARTSAKPGQFRFAKTGDFTLALNRRGKQDINRNVWVCAFYDRDNKLQGVIANASCHAVCITDYTISADFPGVLTSRAAEKFPGVPFLYLQSRGADINPPCDGIEARDRVGNELTDLVFDALIQIEEKDPIQGNLDYLFRKIDLPMCYPEAHKMRAIIENAKAQLTEAQERDDCRRYPEVELTYGLQALREIESGNAEPTLSVDLQVAVLGDAVCLVFVPFEVLTSTGNALEKEICALGIESEHCFIIGYANGTNSYLCPSEESGQEGYETGGASYWYLLPQCCKETEPTVIRELADMVKTLLKF